MSTKKVENRITKKLHAALTEPVLQPPERIWKAIEREVDGTKVPAPKVFVKKRDFAKFFQMLPLFYVEKKIFVGTLAAALFTLIFQSELIDNIINENSNIGVSTYTIIMDSIVSKTTIETNTLFLNELLTSGGMSGMLDTIWLVICAMIFGGVMEAIGALKTISLSLLNIAKSTLNLFASTILSCITVNITASDQYLSIVIPGKMFSEAFRDRKLSNVNLSRTIEDSGTVTSVLIPWNTCGAYQSSVLNVSVFDYFVFAIFNWLSPFMTLFIAAINYKIKKVLN